MIEVSIAGWRRAMVIIGPETALHLASELVRAVGDLGRGGAFSADPEQENGVADCNAAFSGVASGL